MKYFFLFTFFCVLYGYAQIDEKKQIDLGLSHLDYTYEGVKMNLYIYNVKELDSVTGEIIVGKEAYFQFCSPQKYSKPYFLGFFKEKITTKSDKKCFVITKHPSANFLKSCVRKNNKGIFQVKSIL